MVRIIEHRINASVVKAWFQYRCERKTRYEMLAPAALAEAGVEAVVRQRPWAFLGTEFERRVVSALGARVAKPLFGEASVRDEVVRAFLAGKSRAAFLHQADLRLATAPAALGLPPAVTVGSTLADLVELREAPESCSMVVIDIKATRRSTSFHKVQVAFYALLLEARLREAGIATPVDPTGEIWRIPDDGDAAGDRHQVDAFALAPYRRMVESFCRDDLPRILSAPIGPGVDRTFFHVYFKCEECAFLEAHCARAVSPSRPAAERDVSAVAGLSHEAKRSLLRLSVGTVARLAGAQGLRQAYGLGWSLQRRADLLVLRARSAVEGSVLRTRERHTMLMPARADTAVYLSADYDPVDDRLAALGCLIVRADGSRSGLVRVVAGGGREAEADALVAVFGTVLAELGAIDAANCRPDLDRNDAIHAHIFVYEAAEAVTIQGAVGRHVDDPRVRRGLLDMVRLFPPEDTVPEPEFKGVHHLPATAVRLVVEQLYALPVTVSYDLRQVSCAARDAGLLAAAYEPREPFARPFSSLLSIDVARGLGRVASVADVEDDVRARLEATAEVVFWLMAASAAQAAGPEGPMLRLAKRPFRFWNTFDPLDAGDLEVLQAFELIENRAGMLARLVELARPTDRRAETGQCLAGLTLTHFPAANARFPQLVFDMPPSARTSDLGPDSFGLVLTDGDHRVLLDPTSWGNVACRIRSGSRGGRLTVEMARVAFNSAIFQTMYRRSCDAAGAWSVDLIFKDPNTPRVAGYLAFLAAEDPA